MLSSFSRLGRLVADKKGVTAIEYGLIAGLIGVAIIGVVTAIGTDLNALFGTVSAPLATAAN